MGGAGGSGAGTTKVGVGGTPHLFGACWGVLLARHGDPWVGLHGWAMQRRKEDGRLKGRSRWAKGEVERGMRKRSEKEGDCN